MEQQNTQSTNMDCEIEARAADHAYRIGQRHIMYRFIASLPGPHLRNGLTMRFNPNAIWLI